MVKCVDTFTDWLKTVWMSDKEWTIPQWTGLLPATDSLELWNPVNIASSYTISPTLIKKREMTWALVAAHTPEMKRRTATEHTRS